MQSVNDSNDKERIQIGQIDLPGKGTLRFWCPVEGPALEEQMEKVYTLVAEFMVRRMSHSD